MICARGLRVASMPHTCASPLSGDRSEQIEEWNQALRECRVRSKEREVAVELADDRDFAVHAQCPTVVRRCSRCREQYNLPRWSVTSGTTSTTNVCKKCKQANKSMRY